MAAAEIGSSEYEGANMTADTTHACRIGIVGLGIMGSAMAQALLEVGYQVQGFDPAEGAVRRFVEAGGVACSSAVGLAHEADVLILSLPSTEALLASARAIASSSLPGTVGGRERIVIETSTLSIEAKQMAARILEDVGISVLDCPIGGTGATLKDRTWIIFCSGSPTDYDRVRPILEVFSSILPYVGSFGSGTKLKFVANHLLAIYNVAYGESVNFARSMGVDPRQVLDLFGGSQALGTAVMRLRMPFMLEHSYEPPTMKLGVWQKDMQVIGDMAQAVNCRVPLFDASALIYTAAVNLGFGQQDTASVAEVFPTL